MSLSRVSLCALCYGSGIDGRLLVSCVCLCVRQKHDAITVGMHVRHYGPTQTKAYELCVMLACRKIARLSLKISHRGKKCETCYFLLGAFGPASSQDPPDIIYCFHDVSSLHCVGCVCGGVGGSGVCVLVECVSVWGAFY